MATLFVFFICLLVFKQSKCDSYVLSDGQLRIISTSDKCDIGTIEINDHNNGWTKITSTSHCSLATDTSFNSVLGNTICQQLGFNKLTSYQTNKQNIAQTTGFNSINCDEDTTNICKQCELKNEDEIIEDCDHRDVLIECEGINDGNNNNLQCIPWTDYIDDDNIEYKCKNNRVISYNLSSKPFYEDDTFILVVVIIGFVIAACIAVCCCNYLQTEFNQCMKFRPCILILTCKCMGYEGGDAEPVPFDVSAKRKAQLKRDQKDFDNQTAYW